MGDERMRARGQGAWPSHLRDVICTPVIGRGATQWRGGSVTDRFAAGATQFFLCEETAHRAVRSFPHLPARRDAGAIRELVIALVAPVISPVLANQNWDGKRRSRVINEPRGALPTLHRLMRCQADLLQRAGLCVCCPSERQSGALEKKLVMQKGICSAPRTLLCA